MTRPARVLFVCLGNICRSPMAEGVFRRMVEDAGLGDRIEAASAGTGTWHLGEPPHPGTVAVLARRGIALDGKRATRVRVEDLLAADYVVAMDRENVRDLGEILRGVRNAPEIALLLDFAPGVSTRDVPDPYSGGDFEGTYALVESGCRGLLEHVRAREGL